MTKQQAYELIKETFTQSFDKDRFAYFINELLNGYDKSTTTRYTGQMVKHAFKEHVSHCHRLGTYTTPQNDTIDILVVHLTKDSKLERARTAIRNYVAYHLSNRDSKDAALVAFVSPSEKTWRFSYVKMEYKTVVKDSGTVSTKTSLTPARRFSYIVGEGESCHTAQTRFVPLLENDEQRPSIEDIQEAFSVETVTKVFFSEYVALFDRFLAVLNDILEQDANLLDEFTRAQVSPTEYVEKLMSQIVFLYFLQKKGWLGVSRGSNWGDGPKNFLRKLANGDYVVYDNFYNDVLQPLFYNTLATDRGHDAWSKELQCRIPFLNGGLFEPIGNFNWKSFPIMLPNSLFTNNDYIEEHVYGTGILDVFDRYNFTVNEDEPLEREVAIDPEMLGKIFESLIEENRRKGLGTFYTPREIVHFMCKESLINHLDSRLADAAITIDKEDIERFIQIGDHAAFYEAARIDGYISYKQELPDSILSNAKVIDNKLAEITVCDPAVGSGAFLVGMMKEIVRCRSALTPYFNDPHERTPYHFKRHAIQSSLYGVDIDAGAIEIAKLRLWLSLVVDEENVTQIKPLPNLDYKVVIGNSLLSIEIDAFNTHLFRQLENEKNLLFDETDMNKKAEHKRKIDALIDEITDGEKVFDYELFFSEVFHEEKGFDVVIANPPYVRQEKITYKKKLEEQNYEVYTGGVDLYVFFYELGLKLLKENGTLSFITSNKWMRTDYGKKLRRLLAHDTTLKLLVDFRGFQVFGATVDTNIIILQKQKPNSEDQLSYFNIPKGYKGEDLEAYIQKNLCQFRQKELNENGWILEDEDVLKLKQKLDLIGKPLGESDVSINYGIKTGYNPAFIIDTATKEGLCKEDPRSIELIKPALRGRNISKYSHKWAGEWLIGTFPALKLDIDDYPAIKAHLQSFGKRLEQSGKPGCRKRTSNKWFETQDNIAYHIDFEKPKIIYPVISGNCSFAYDDQGVFANDTVFLITGENLIPLLGILNSRLLEWYFRLINALLGSGGMAFRKIFVETVPIPSLSKDPGLTDSLTHKVQSILNMDESQRESEIYEQTLAEIDQIVYQLYELTPEEIALVEGN